MPAVTLLVGTKKAGFIYTSDASREHWEVSGPMMAGSNVSSMAIDTRGGTPRLFAASNHFAWGRAAARSDDFGKTWDLRSPGLSFAADSGQSVDNVWIIAPGAADQPGVVYAGTQPACRPLTTSGMVQRSPGCWACSKANFRPERWPRRHVCWPSR